jgi:hypothetical protein
MPKTLRVGGLSGKFAVNPVLMTARTLQWLYLGLEDRAMAVMLRAPSFHMPFSRPM